MRQDDVGDNVEVGMPKYQLEFILNTYDAKDSVIRNSLVEFGDNLEICEVNDGCISRKDFKISITTQEPTIIFDVCSEFGRIKSIRINES